MNVTIHLHVRESTSISAHVLDTGTAVVALGEEARVFLTTAAHCDRLIKAATEAKRLLSGEPVACGAVAPHSGAVCSQPPGHDGNHTGPMRPGGIPVVWDREQEVSLAAAEASPANPYGSAKHGEFGGSAAEVAEGVEPPHAMTCPAFGHAPSPQYPCNCGVVANDATWPQEPTGHLPQHTGCEPGCTYDGCTQHGAAVTR